jgi:cystathionine beta-lyase/cystathionine gamma-synthase
MSDRFETRAIHAGEPRPFIDGAISMPVFHSATYEYAGPAEGKSLRYTRLGNNPNQICVEQKLASLEGGEAALVTASGMAAISTSLLANIPEGGHLLAQDSLYGGTVHFLHDYFPSLGRQVSFFDPERKDSWKENLRPNTKGIYVESISNPLLKMADLREVVAFARQHDLLSFIDNTFPSPFNFNPLALGFDVVLHSATKYLNGHSDLVGGAVVAREGLITPTRKLMATLGGSLDAQSCFLLNRGLKTLAVRMRAHNESALALARALEGHRKISRIFYPGLPGNPAHGLAKELFRGFGGMLAFEYQGSGKEAEAFTQRLRLPAVAPSLGGVESLVSRPVVASHSYMLKPELDRAGIRENLVRVSVGLETPEDLIADFLQAL